MNAYIIFSHTEYISISHVNVGMLNSFNNIHCLYIDSFIFPFLTIYCFLYSNVIFFFIIEYVCLGYWNEWIEFILSVLGKLFFLWCRVQSDVLNAMRHFDCINIIVKSSWIRSVASTWYVLRRKTNYFITLP